MGAATLLPISDRGSLTAERLLTLVAVIAVLSFHWLGALADLPTVPFGERVAVAAVLVGWAAGTTWIPWLRVRHRGTFELVFSLLGLWVVRVGMLTGFETNRVLVVLMAIFGIGLIFEHVRIQLAFYGVVMLVLWWGMQIHPPEHLEPVMVVVVMGVLATFTAVAHANRRRLVSSLEQLSLVARHVPNGVVIADEGGRVAWLNERFGSGLLQRREDLVGRPLASFYLQDDPAQRQSVESLQAWIGGEITEPPEELVRRLPSGEDRTVALDLAWVEEPRGPKRIVAIERDVTAARAYVERLLEQRERAQAELREAEERAQHAQRLEALGRLAGGVAHDFNNLLAVIIGYLSVVEKKLAASDAVRRPVEQAHKAAGRAAELTRQLLAFSRQQVLNPRVVDLDGALDEMQGLLEGLAGHGVTLERRRAPRPLRVEVDPGQLQQVVMNLVINARDAQPGGGRIVVQAEEARLEGAAARRLGLPEGRYVMLTVIDQGEGMTPEVRSQIFEPFYSTKEASRGTGLGLSTAMGIVAQSGGTIDVESRPGKGSRFTVYLPASDAPEVSAETAAEPVEIGGTETILVVEDRPEVADMVRNVLEAAGYQVQVASGASEARKVFREGGVDLLLTDVVLPGVSGPDLVRGLREEHGPIPVLFMSGYTKRYLGDEGTVRSDVHFLPKPFEPTELLQAVRRALDAAPT